MNTECFKTGDVVRIRSWDNMQSRYGLRDDDCIDCLCGFVSDMKHLCGKSGLVIKSVVDDIVKFSNFDCPWGISTDMLEHDYGTWTIPRGSTAVDPELYNFRQGAMLDSLKINDVGELQCEFDKDSYDKIVKGLWETEEKKEGNEMKLVEIYEERALKIINDAQRKEIDETIQKNPIITKFNKLVEDFEKKTAELYASQNLLDDIVLVEHISSSLYKYKISSVYRDKIGFDIDEKYNKIRENLRTKLEEVNAQLELYERMPAEDAVLEIQTMLVSYGILNSDGTVATYTLPGEKCDCENCKDCEKVPGGETEKRGRKKKREGQ